MALSRWRAQLRVEALDERLVPATTGHLLAVAADAGGYPVVNVYNTDYSLRTSFQAFASSFNGGARVATGDVTGDGVPDFVTGAGPSGGPQVNIYDGATGALVRGFFAFDTAFQGGVSVAAGTSNGRPIIAIGAGPGGLPIVKVYEGSSGQEVTEFLAFDQNFRGGVNVAIGDVTGTGRGTIIVGAGRSGVPVVNEYDAANGTLTGSFMAFDPNFRGGVSVAAGNVLGTGRDAIVAGAGPGGFPVVSVFDGSSGTAVQSFYAFDQAFRGGVSVGVQDGVFGTRSAIYAGAGPGGVPDVRVFDALSGAAARDFLAFDAAFRGGVAVGNGYGYPPRPVVVSLPASAGNNTVFVPYPVGGGSYGYPYYGYGFGLGFGLGYPYYGGYYDPSLYYDPYLYYDPSLYYDPGYYDPGYYSDPGFSDFSGGDFSGGF